MSIQKVKEFFKKYGMEERVLEFNSSSATVELAAQTLGCNPARIAKTLYFIVNSQPVLIVTAGDAKVDNPKFKAQFNTKAKMIPHDAVEQMTGHAVGGVCPFAVNQNVNVDLDISLKRFHSVFPACGSSCSAIELTIPELEKYSNSMAWIDVCKEWLNG